MTTAITEGCAACRKPLASVDEYFVTTRYKRRGAKTCSPRCRQAMSRSRKVAKASATAVPPSQKTS